MKKYLAIYRLKNGQLKTMQEQYKNMKSFRSDLKCNGYKVIMILTEKNLKTIKNTKKHYNLNMTKFKKYKFDFQEDLFNYLKEDFC